MKKLTVLILAFLCVLGAVGCHSRSYTCRIATAEEDLKLQPSELSEPCLCGHQLDLTDPECGFVVVSHAPVSACVRTNRSGSEWQGVLFEDYLKSISEEGTSFTYEILDTHLGIYQEKETVVYFVRVVYGEGFTFLSGVEE